VNFVIIKCISEYMQFTTQQLRSDATDARFGNSSVLNLTNRTMSAWCIFLT